MQTRRGACPTLQAPMQTGDGLLLRVTLADRALTPTQLAGLADAAGRFGNGIVEITARGNLQFRGFGADSAPRFAQAVDRLGIAAREGLAVGLSPLAGLDQTEIADPRPLADAIHEAITRQNLSDRVAPKTSVLVDGGDRIGLQGLKADIRLHARTPELWALSVGKREIGHVATANAKAAVMRVLAILAAHGRDARGADLDPDDLTVLNDILVEAPASQNARMAFDPIGLFQLAPDISAVGLVAAFGQTSATALAAIAEEAAASFRPGPGGLLLAISPRDPVALIARAKRDDFIVATGDPRRSISACPGTKGCASGHISARELASALAALPGLPPDLHVSGCEKGCARHGAASVTIVGTGDGTNVILRGTTRDAPAFRTNTDDPAVLAALIHSARAA